MRQHQQQQSLQQYVSSNPVSRARAASPLQQHPTRVLNRPPAQHASAAVSDEYGGVEHDDVVLEAGGGLVLLGQEAEVQVHVHTSGLREDAGSLHVQTTGLQAPASSLHPHAGSLQVHPNGVDRNSPMTAVPAQDGQEATLSSRRQSFEASTHGSRGGKVAGGSGGGAGGGNWLP